MMLKSSALTMVSLIVAMTGTIVRAAIFQGLGDLPGGDFYSEAGGVSADGSVVVGYSSTTSGYEAFRWTKETGMVGLGELTGDVYYSRAYDISADGSTIVGQSIAESGYEGFRWTNDGGMVALGDLPGGNFWPGNNALGVSADGSVIVGAGASLLSGPEYGYEAFHWTSNGGMMGLGDLPGGDFFSVASDVSADGSVVVGYGVSDLSDPGPEAFRWTSDGGMVAMGDLHGGTYDSLAYGVSNDGSVVVGHGTSDSGREAFRWTSATGMVGLGDLSGGIYDSWAYDVSGDGSVVVGRGVSASGNEAFIWDEINGMRNLKDVLVNEFGLDLSGWTLGIAEGISDDGLTIIGYGANPSGNTEAWIATVPEPCTIGLLVLGGLGLLRRQRI